MTLNFGEKIRKFRRDRDLTQDELAQAIGVSYQSVSKWERDDGYPDITLLPVIANYFGVTIDALLGNDGTDEAVYGEYSKKFDELRNSGNVKAAFELALEYYRKYPNSDRIDYYAWGVCIMVHCILGDDNSPENREKYVPVLKEVCERNISKSTAQFCRKYSIGAMCANCDDEDINKWYDMCTLLYSEVGGEVLEDRLWRQKMYDDSRERFDMNNLRLILHYLTRPSRNEALPQKIKDWFCEKICVVEFLGENGEVPSALLRFYAELHYHAACAAFGCGERDEGYAYLEKAFDCYSRWLEIPMGEELEFGRKVIFGGFKMLKGKNILVYPDGNRVEYWLEGWDITAQKNDFLYNAMTSKEGWKWFDCGEHGWEWFDSVRGEDLFKEYVEKARVMMEKYKAGE